MGVITDFQEIGKVFQHQDIIYRGYYLYLWQIIDATANIFTMHCISMQKY